VVAIPYALPPSGAVIGLRDNHFGMFAAGGPVTINGVHQNVYHDVTTELGTSPTFS
jgi:hypothetical protein